jgi:hypothetical protein
MRLCELNPECLKMEQAINIKVTSVYSNNPDNTEKKRERQEGAIIYIFTFYRPTATSQ